MPIIIVVIMYISMTVCAEKISGKIYERLTVLGQEGQWYEGWGSFY